MTTQSTDSWDSRPTGGGLTKPKNQAQRDHLDHRCPATLAGGRASYRLLE